MWIKVLVIVVTILEAVIKIIDVLTSKLRKEIERE